jgi:hypothetical protein
MTKININFSFIWKIFSSWWHPVYGFNQVESEIPIAITNAEVHTADPVFTQACFH